MNNKVKKLIFKILIQVKMNRNKKKKFIKF
jgi:hypothetical protein